MRRFFVPLFLIACFAGCLSTSTAGAAAVSNLKAQEKGGKNAKGKSEKTVSKPKEASKKEVNPKSTADAKKTSKAESKKEKEKEQKNSSSSSDNSGGFSGSGSSGGSSGSGNSNPPPDNSGSSNSNPPPSNPPAQSSPSNQGGSPNNGSQSSGAEGFIISGEGLETGGVTVTSGAGSLFLDSGASTTYSGSFAYSSILTSAAAGTINVSSGSTGFVLTGSSNLRLVLSGSNTTLTISGSSGRNGGTTLNSGTLNVTNTNALGSGTLTLNGGTLEADPSVNEILVNGDLVWSSSATISLIVTSDTTTSQFVDVTGTLSMTGSGTDTFELDPLGLTPGNHYDFLLMTVDGGFGNITASDFAFTSTDTSLSGTFSISGSNLYFNDGYGTTDVSPVPEPSSTVLVILGVCVLLTPFVRKRLQRERPL